MNLEQKVDSIESEMALVKGEIKQTLVDLREFLMKQGSPFMVGGDGGDGSIAQNVVDQMLEQAQAVAREEASVGLQRGLEDLHRENQRQLEAIQAQVAMAPGAGEEVMAEIEELRRQGREQAASSQRQLEEVQARQATGGGGADTAELRLQIENLQAQPAAGGGGADTAELRRQMEDMRRESERQMEALRAQQTTAAPDSAAAADLQRRMDEMQRDQKQQMDAVQAQAAAQAAQAIVAPPVLGAQVVQAPPGAQVIEVQPAPQRQAQELPVVLSVEEAPPAPSAELTGQVQPPPLPAQQVQVEVPFATPEAPAAVQYVDPIAPPLEAPLLATGPVVPPGQEPLPVVGAGVAPGLVAPAPQQVSPLAEQLQGNAALDANLLASLIRWVGGIKRRLGADQLPGFIEMYKLTGHLPVVVERLVLHVATLDALPDESSDQIFTLDDVMDSLLQLHAIVYGPGHSVQGALAGLLEEQPQTNA